MKKDCKLPSGFSQKQCHATLVMPALGTVGQASLSTVSTKSELIEHSFPGHTQKALAVLKYHFLLVSSFR